MTSPNTVLFGDSITQGCGPGGGWFYEGNRSASYPLSFLGPNMGVGGDQVTVGMQTRLPSVVSMVNAGRTVVVVEGGGNDLTNGKTAAQVITGLTTIYQALRAAGAIVIATTVLPTTFIDTGSEQTEFAAVNAWIRPHATDTGLAHLIADWTTAMSSGSEWVPGSGLTVDGVHPSDAGWKVMGPVLAPKLVSAAAMLTTYRPSGIDGGSW